MPKMRLTQRGNGGRYDEFGDCIKAARASIVLVIFSIFLGSTLGLSHGVCIVSNIASNVNTYSENKY